MRPTLFALLACLILLPAMPGGMTMASVQSIGLAESGSSLMTAFQAVQKADSLGAPADQVAELSEQLNTALTYHNIAVELSSEGDITGSEYYSTLSNNVSTLVLDKALALQNLAESDRLNQQLIAYSTAIAAAIVSSFIGLEYHRIPNFIRRKKLNRTRLRQGDKTGPKN